MSYKKITIHVSEKEQELFDNVQKYADELGIGFTTTIKVLVKRGLSNTPIQQQAVHVTPEPTPAQMEPEEQQTQGQKVAKIVSPSEVVIDKDKFEADFF